MDHSTATVPLHGAVRQFFHRLIAIGENRFELLVVEIEEERNRILDMVFMGLAIATLGLLGVSAFSAAIVLVFWDSHPIAALLIMGAIYLTGGGLLLLRLLGSRRRPPTLAGTFDQLRKDCECIRKN